MLSVCLAAAMVPATAAAQSADTLPDGNSAVDQYVDPLPDADGDRPLGHPAANGSGGKPAPGAISNVPLPLKTQAALAKRGADGYRVAGIVRDSSPPEAAPAGGGPVGDLPDVRAVRRDSVADVIGGTAGGMGGWLPFVLAAVALAATAAAILSRRSPP